MLRRPLLAAAAALAGLGRARAAEPPKSAANTGPVTLESWGSFHVGGHEVTLSGKPVREVVLGPGGVPAKMDPNGTYLAGGMYAQYMIPAERRGAHPLLLWHGGGADRRLLRIHAGRAGRLATLLFCAAAGRSTCPTPWSAGAPAGRCIRTSSKASPSSSPSTTRGSGSASAPVPDPTSSRPPIPGCEFPSDPASYANFMRQCVPRFTTTDDWTLAAYGALLERVGPSVVLVHSQAGLFGWRAAQEWPDKVRALVLVEPATVGDPAKVAALKDIPQLVIYGDFIAQDSRWPTIRKNGLAFAAQVRQAGGQVDVIDLPDHGIHGNCHMMIAGQDQRPGGGRNPGLARDQGPLASGVTSMPEPFAGEASVTALRPGNDDSPLGRGRLARHPAPASPRCSPPAPAPWPTATGGEREVRAYVHLFRGTGQAVPRYGVTPVRRSDLPKRWKPLPALGFLRGQLF